MSILRVTSLRGRTSGTSPTLPDGAVVTTNASGGHAGVGIITARGLEATGIVTATSFKGSASGLTAVPSAQLSGALPALDGSALTNLNIPAGFTELDAALFN